MSIANFEKAEAARLVRADMERLQLGQDKYAARVGLTQGQINKLVNAKYGRPGADVIALVNALRRGGSQAGVPNAPTQDPMGNNGGPLSEQSVLLQLVEAMNEMRAAFVAQQITLVTLTEEIRRLSKKRK